MHDDKSGKPTSETVMAQLSEALDRLEGAIERLQGALSQRERRATVEQERLAEELKEVRASHSVLEDEARAVSSRLDTAIGRLRTVMEA